MYDKVCLLYANLHPLITKLKSVFLYHVTIFEKYDDFLQNYLCKDYQVDHNVTLRAKMAVKWIYATQNTFFQESLKKCSIQLLYIGLERVFTE